MQYTTSRFCIDKFSEFASKNFPGEIFFNKKIQLFNSLETVFFIFLKFPSCNLFLCEDIEDFRNVFFCSRVHTKPTKKG